MDFTQSQYDNREEEISTLNNNRRESNNEKNIEENNKQENLNLNNQNLNGEKFINQKIELLTKDNLGKENEINS